MIVRTTVTARPNRRTQIHQIVYVQTDRMYLASSTSIGYYESQHGPKLHYERITEERDIGSEPVQPRTPRSSSMGRMGAKVAMVQHNCQDPLFLFLSFLFSVARTFVPRPWTSHRRHLNSRSTPWVRPQSVTFGRILSHWWRWKVGLLLRGW